MTLTTILLWILLISSSSLFGSWYARRYNKTDALVGLYVAFVLFSNIAAVKIAQYDLGIVVFTATAASLIFPVTFLLTDVVNEKFGRLATQQMILVALASQVCIALFSYLVLALPAAPFWTNQESLQMVLGQVPRIMIAGWVAFFISENIDAYIFSWFKKLTHGRHLWARNVFSSIPAMLLDSILFVLLAFGGTTNPILPLIIGVTSVKWLVGLINIPFMYVNRAMLGKQNDR